MQAFGPAQAEMTQPVTRLVPIRHRVGPDGKNATRFAVWRSVSRLNPVSSINLGHWPPKI